MLKQRLILLSDLWGAPKADWITNYENLLKNSFELQFYDSCKLGNIDTTPYEEKHLHAQFKNGGIERAVSRLLKLESARVDVVAFSVGGVIAWKAALAGLKINRLFTVSATRLRYETKAPSCYTKCYFGELDPFNPSLEWMEVLDINYQIVAHAPHTIYQQAEFTAFICNEISK